MRTTLVLPLVTWLLLLLPLSAHASAAERQQIEAERRVVQERSTAEERACQGRFAVTDCVEQVRARKRDALAPLRERELRLDEAERRRRGDERKKAIAAKREAAAQRLLPPPPLEQRLRQPAPAGSAPPRAPASAAAPAAAATEAERRAQAARRAQASQQRRLAAQDAQDRVARRLAERSLRGKQAEPLPVPPASALAASAGQ